MTTTNLWKRLKQLLPEAQLLVGVVTATTAYGAMVELPDGAVIIVRGEAATGQHVFVRDGLIEGVAPNLATVLIEV